MPLYWWEIGLLTGLNAAIIAAIMVLFLRYGAPKLLSKAEVWMGGAIGRFMAGLTKQAAEEEGSSASGLNLGGLKIDSSTIQSIAQLLKMAQGMGFLKGGGGSGSGGGGW